MSYPPVKIRTLLFSTRGTQIGGEMPAACPVEGNSRRSRPKSGVVSHVACFAVPPWPASRTRPSVAHLQAFCKHLQGQRRSLAMADVVLGRQLIYGREMRLIATHKLRANISMSHRMLSFPPQQVGGSGSRGVGDQSQKPTPSALMYVVLHQVALSLPYDLIFIYPVLSGPAVHMVELGMQQHLRSMHRDGRVSLQSIPRPVFWGIFGCASDWTQQPIFVSKVS